MRRRSMLGAVGLVTAGLTSGLAVGCRSSSAPSSPSASTLTWWDHVSGNEDLKTTFFADYTKETGVGVEYTYQQSSKLGQALQLAKRSNQLPDVFTTAGLGLPFLGLVDGGWFQPLQWGDEENKRIPTDYRVDGLNAVDGKLYSFPVQGSRLFNANLWHNKDLLEQAGIEPPATYDELRHACVMIKKATPQVKGLVINQDATFGLMVDNAAQSAGFQGADGSLFRTGEFRWHDDAYVEWLEFLLSLDRDGHLLQGQFNSDSARGRFAAGQCAFLLDGIWTPGTIKQYAEPFLPKLGVSGPITPEPGREPVMYRSPTLSKYYLSGSSKHPSQASKLLAMLTTPAFSSFIASRMLQTPLDPDQLDNPDVEPVFRDQVKKALTRAFMMPEVARRDPKFASILSKIKPVKPGLNEIFQGLLSGQLTDARAALRQFSDDSTGAREDVLEHNKLTVDDVSFPNWKPLHDYTQEMYQA